MADDYCPEVCKELAEHFERAQILRPRRVDRYDDGQELTYRVRGIFPAREADVRLRIERFVGGGFAGQVYRVEVLHVDTPDGEIAGLRVGGSYAMKILVPPSSFARRFRDAIYAIGFQAPFSPQVSPASARAGALWQKLIRRGAGLRFGTERSVVDIFATFVDERIGSCGELSEWVEGRTWKFEVDDHLFARRRWRVGQPADHLGSPEYRAKKQFMADFVDLLHEMGAPELARQYEWWTCKSQPNALKRSDTEDDPAAGLTAVDFRAGLALLPFLPMSPGDVPLIARGIARGSLVQFDRGDLRRLKRYVDAHEDHFADMGGAIEELRTAERDYRDSMPDVTHHHVRLLYQARLWGAIRRGLVGSWSIRGMTDERTTRLLTGSRLLTLIFLVLGLAQPGGVLAAVAMLIAGLGWGAWPPQPWATIPLVGVALPVAARVLRKLWGRGDLRRHYARMCASASYLSRGMRAHLAETLIRWHRKGRIGPDRARRLMGRPVRAFGHLLLSPLPAMLHRMLTDRSFAAEKLRYVFVRPVRLYFNPEAREEWLLAMVAEGQRNHMLSVEDTERILARIKEPFIQKYLKSLAVHVCTLPVTQVISVVVAAGYVLSHPELSWQESTAAAVGILAAFQITPISPGSLVRGLYVLYLVLRERNVRDYNIAVLLGFFKYVGYLAFPIQMAYRYPALARFMASHWASGAVHAVPVFGERGALLEHAVFDLFYNAPLTLRRGMRIRAERRAKLRPRRWHVLPIVVAGGALLTLIDAAARTPGGDLPGLREVWYAALGLPLLAGMAAAAAAGGMRSTRRVVWAAVCGALLAAGHSALRAGLAGNWGADGADAAAWLLTMLRALPWRAFVYTIFAVVGGVVCELDVAAETLRHPPDS